MQSTTEYDGHRGSEDCLYPNVYASKDSTPQSNLPVIVWLHGGGFINGSGNDFDGARLADTAGAIVVTVNYRLGPLGWLALDSLSDQQGGASGNYGMLDQIAALQWVRDNIGGFGGNPHLVTLSGQSAGGESVLALVASPQAAGLFERADVLSAPAGLPLPTVADASARNNAGYATELGCTDRATQVACLRAVPAEQALAAGHETLDLISHLGLYWTLTVGSPNLPDQWLNLFTQNRYNHVPIMIGNTRDEARLFVAIYENNTGHPMTEATVTDTSSEFFGPLTPVVSASYKAPRYPTPGDQMTAIITDSSIACGDNLDRDALLATGVPDIYSYEFSDPNAFDVEVHGQFTDIGDGHDADLPFWFQYNHGRHAQTTRRSAPGNACSPNR